MTENKYLADGPLVVAIDSSTTSTKAIVVDAEGNIWHTAKQNIQLHTPAMDQYEHNPIRWWETSRATIGEVLSKLSPTDRSRIAAIGITHQRESFAPFDKDGRPLRNGILWLDGRATEQIRRYGSEHIHELSGKPAGVTPAIYKMAWVKEHEPEIFTDAYKVMEVHGYIAWMLTGRPVSSQAAADSLGLFDIQKRDWSDELLDIAGVSREQMADLVEPSYEMGTLRKELAEEWGIAEVPVIAGLGDGQAAGIGAAAVDPAIGFLNLGTAVNAGVDSPVYRYDKVFRTHVSGVPGNYVFEVLQSSGSYLAGWFRETLGDPKLLSAPAPALDEAASLIPPGCEGLVTLPYWNAVQSPPLGLHRPRRRRRLARHPLSRPHVPLNPRIHRIRNALQPRLDRGGHRREAHRTARDGWQHALPPVAPDHGGHHRPAHHRVHPGRDLRARCSGPHHGLDGHLRRA